MFSYGVGKNLFTVDKAGCTVPELSTSAERIDELSWKVTLAAFRFFSHGMFVIVESAVGGFANIFKKNKIALTTGWQAVL